MDEWSEHCTCNLEAQNSGPTLTASSIICSQLGPELNSLATLLNSQLVYPWPAGNFLFLFIFQGHNVNYWNDKTCSYPYRVIT